MVVLCVAEAILLRRWSVLVIGQLVLWLGSFNIALFLGQGSKQFVVSRFFIATFYNVLVITSITVRDTATVLSDL